MIVSNAEGSNLVLRRDAASREFAPEDRARLDKRLEE